jgi:hypothetical protein
MTVLAGMERKEYRITMWDRGDRKLERLAENKKVKSSERNKKLLVANLSK